MVCLLVVPLCPLPPLLQVSTYLPSYLPAEQIFQPAAPKPDDVAVLLEGDEEIDVETLRRKGEGGRA